MNGTTLQRPTAIPSSRLPLTEDGHTDPAALLDLLADADARRGSSGLAFIAAHTSATTVTAQARADFPRVVIETIRLDEGVPLVHREVESTKRHHIAWDPAQMTRDKVEIYINIYIAGSGAYVEYTPEAYQALRGFEAIRRVDSDPNAVAFFDQVEQAVIAADDPKAAVLRIADLLTAERAKR